MKRLIPIFVISMVLCAAAMAQTTITLRVQHVTTSGQTLDMTWSFAAGADERTSSTAEIAPAIVEAQDFARAWAVAQGFNLAAQNAAAAMAGDLEVSRHNTALRGRIQRRFVEFLNTAWKTLESDIESLNGRIVELE
jgi:hypothetical protein